MKFIYQNLLIILLLIGCNQSKDEGSSSVLKSLSGESKRNLWFVSNIEKGKADGTSWENAWSYSNFPQDIVKGGDTIFVDGGEKELIYSNVWLIENINGGYGEPVVIMNGKDSNHNGQVVFYRDTTNLDMDWKTGHNLYVGGHSRNIKFKNLKFIYAYRNIGIDKVKKIYFDSCTVLVNYEAGFSVGDTKPGTDSLIVENCNLSVNYPNVKGKWYQGDCWIQSIADNVTIRNNYFVITNGGDNTHSDVIQIYGKTSTNLQIYNNIFRNNKTYSYLGNNQIMYITSINGIVKIYNNVIISSSHYSQSPMLDISASDELDSLLIYNNSFYGKHQQRGIIVSGLHLSPNSITQIKNNAIYSTGNVAIAIDKASVGNIIINNNISFAPDNPNQTYQYDGIYKSFVEWQMLGFDIYGANKNPKYISIAFDKENLQSANGSPCINAGDSVPWIKYDKNGIKRPQGSAYDIGAYER